jgi:hypothetical protein
MARFMIADISDAKSVLHELRAIVPGHAFAARAATHCHHAGGAGYVRLLPPIRNPGRAIARIIPRDVWTI